MAKGTNGSIRQNAANKRQWKIDWDKRCTFFQALQLMSGQEVTVSTPVAPVRLKERSEEQLSPRFHSAVLLCCNYSRGLGALWALSGGATPSAAAESVLLRSTLAVRITHLKERNDGVPPNTLWVWHCDLTLQLGDSCSFITFWACRDLLYLLYLIQIHLYQNNRIKNHLNNKPPFQELDTFVKVFKIPSPWHNFKSIFVLLSYMIILGSHFGADPFNSYF